MQKTVFYYQYHSRVGPITLWPMTNDRYSVMYQDENLGAYHSPMAAADDVSGGSVSSPSDDVKFEELDIPADLGEWDKKVLGNFGRLQPG